MVYTIFYNLVQVYDILSGDETRTSFLPRSRILEKRKVFLCLSNLIH